MVVTNLYPSSQQNLRVEPQVTSDCNTAHEAFLTAQTPPDIHLTDSRSMTYFNGFNQTLRLGSGINTDLF